MIGLSVQDRGFTRQLKRLHNHARNPRGLMMVMGRELGNQLKGHFRKRDRDNPSSLGSAGGRRQHFWLGVSRAVQVPVVSRAGRKVTVSVNHPAIAQKVYGGTIRAKRASMLAIPVIPEAYGRAPAVFEQETGKRLAVVGSGGKAVLGFEGANGFFTAAYVLKRSVDQKPDPNALPPDGPLSQALIRRGEAYVLRTSRV